MAANSHTKGKTFEQAKAIIEYRSGGTLTIERGGDRLVAGRKQVGITVCQGWRKVWYPSLKAACEDNGWYL